MGSGQVANASKFFQSGSRLQSAKKNSNEVKFYPVAARAPTIFRINTIPAIPLRPLSLALIRPQLTSSPTTTSSVFSPEELVFAIAALKLATSPYLRLISSMNT
jgi:hypothetical protein